MMKKQPLTDEERKAREEQQAKQCEEAKDGHSGTYYEKHGGNYAKSVVKWPVHVQNGLLVMIHLSNQHVCYRRIPLSGDSGILL